MILLHPCATFLCRIHLKIPSLTTIELIPTPLPQLFQAAEYNHL